MAAATTIRTPSAAVGRARIADRPAATVLAGSVRAVRVPLVTLHLRFYKRPRILTLVM
jgi:hypothetical protein